MKNNEQKINGNYNSQQALTINGNVNIGLTTKDVIELIKNYCITDKEQIIGLVKETIQDIEKEDLRAPDKRIFVPLIQQLTYSIDDINLKQIYKNLLKSSMKTTKKDLMHPSFLSIINQLNSDEIKLLNVIPFSPGMPSPLIDVRMLIGENAHLGYPHIRNFTDIPFGVCEHPENCGAYIENLARLKLIEISDLRSISDENVYSKLKNHSAIINVINKTKDSPLIRYEFDEKLFYLTQFGYNFLCCCKD